MKIVRGTIFGILKGGCLTLVCFLLPFGVSAKESTYHFGNELLSYPFESHELFRLAFDADGAMNNNADPLSFGRLLASAFQASSENIIFSFDTASQEVALHAATEVSHKAERSLSFFPGDDQIQFVADGENNKGILSLDRDTEAKKSFYTWQTRQTSLTDYTVVLQFSLPEDFAQVADDFLEVEYRTGSTNAQDAYVDVVMKHDGKRFLFEDGDSLVSSSSEQWEKKHLSLRDVDVPLRPSDMVNIEITLHSRREGGSEVGYSVPAQLGDVTVFYYTEE